MRKYILPIEIPGVDERIYAGFWRRFGAFLIDFIIIIPVALFFIYINKLSRLNVIYTYSFSYSVYLFYNFYLVHRYEGTPGKRLTKIKIRKKNGKRIQWRQVILREIVTFALFSLTTAAYIIATLKMSDGEFESLSNVERMARISELYPVWQKPADWLYQIWMWGEFIVLLTNKRKRALHDFIAGTVVIKDKFETVAEQINSGDGKEPGGQTG